MNDGYRPHATYITKTLILTFIGGVIVGIAIGWGAKPSGTTDPAGPDAGVRVAQLPETTSPPPADTESVSPLPAGPDPVSPAATESPDPADPAGEIAPASTDIAPPPAVSSFDPDVDGRWPAAHLFVGIAGTKADGPTQEMLNEFKPGGVVLGPENVVDSVQLSALVLQIKRAVGMGTTLADPPVILYADDRGAAPRLLGETVEATDDPDVVLSDAAAGPALEARHHGIGALVSPVLDFPEPDLNADRRAALISRGLDMAGQIRGAGVLPVAAHFPGAGLAVEGSDGHWSIPAEQMDALAEAMQPFKAAMDAGIAGLLVGHMAVPGIDSDRPNRPASLSPRLLRMLVRDEWGYEGLVLADDITGHPMTRDLPRDEIVLKALVSGCDAVILKDATWDDLYLICETFVRLSDREDFPAEAIEASKARLRQWLTLLDAPAPLVVAAASPVPAESAPIEPAPPLPEPEGTPESAAVTPEPEAPTPEPEAAEHVMPDDSSDAVEPDAAAEPAAAEPETATPADDVVATAAADGTAPAPAPETSGPPDSAAGDAAPSDPDSDNVVDHKIAKGESLTAIANRYRVKMSDIQAWNDLEGEEIKYGRTLKIHLPVAAGEAVEAAEAGDAEPVEANAEIASPDEPAETEPPVGDTTEVAAAPEAEKNPEEADPSIERPELRDGDGETADESEPVAPSGSSPEKLASGDDTEGPAPAAPKDQPLPGTFELYEVVAGDNLRRIAQRFNTSQKTLMEWNDIESADHVQIGWKLKVPKQAASEAPREPASPGAAAAEQVPSAP